MNNWLENFNRYVETKTAHTFLFHGNVADDVLYEDSFHRIYEILHVTPMLQDAAIVAYFNLASGMRFPAPEMEVRFLRLVIQPIIDALPGDATEKPTPKEYFNSHKRDLAHVLTWCDELLTRFSWNNIKQVASEMGFTSEDLEKFFKQPVSSTVPFAAVAFEYQETKTPPESASGSSRLDRQVLETFQWWAQLPAIQDSHNLVLLFADALSGIAPQLHMETKGIIPIEVPLPDREEQKESLEAFRREGTLVTVEEDGQEIGVEEFARLTAGLSRVELRHVFREARAHGQNSLTSETLFKKKAELIETRLGDMVSLSRPPWGWEVIGGMDLIVMQFMIWAEAMKQGNLAVLPKGGVLCTGAPGTGKTVSWEAFAHEVDIPFVVVRNTMNSFVGQSERNVEMLLDTLWALRPCVVFIDEIDQMFLPRGEVYHGDSGVSARTSRMWMQFLSDPMIHGQIMVGAATNHPDLMDSAMKRAGRFGAKLPYLIPSKKNRPGIWRALLRKEVIRLAQMDIELDISEVIGDDNLIQRLSEMADFYEDKGGLVCGPPPPNRNVLDIPEDEKTIPLTGAELEDIISLAFRPIIPASAQEIFSALPQEERKQFILDHLKALDISYPVLTGDMLEHAMRVYLPHEDVRTYRAMDNLALMSVNNLDLIPPEHHDRVRRLRASKNKSQ